jgi:hypothetical protein
MKSLSVNNARLAMQEQQTANGSDSPLFPTKKLVNY